MHRFLRLLALCALAGLGLPALAQANPQNYGAITTTYINGQYIVGSVLYPTIQSAVTSACASRFNSQVVIPFGASPTDTVAAATGCLLVSILDNRFYIPAFYPGSTSGYTQGIPNLPIGLSVLVGEGLGTASAATSSTNFNSAYLQFISNYWNGSTGANDLWTLQAVLGTGTNATSTLLFSHAGTSGAVAVGVPNLALPSGGVLGWNGDTGFSRQGAGVLFFGNGTAGSQAGALYLGSLFSSNLIAGYNMQAYTQLGTLATSTATSSANYSSPNLFETGTYWNGSASASDTWSWQNVLGTGTNPTSTLTLTHSGSNNATVYVSMPSLSIAGTLGVTGNAQMNSAVSVGGVLSPGGGIANTINNALTVNQTIPLGQRFTEINANNLTVAFPTAPSSGSVYGVYFKNYTTTLTTSSGSIYVNNMTQGTSWSSTRTGLVDFVWDGANWYGYGNPAATTITQTGCTITAGAVGNTCPNSVTLPTAQAQPDALYIPDCILVSPSGTVTLGGYTVTSGTAFTVSSVALSTTATGAGTLRCTVTGHI